MAVSGEKSVAGVTIWLAEPGVMHGLPKPPKESEMTAVSPTGRVTSHGGVRGHIQRVSEVLLTLSGIPNGGLEMS